MPRSAHESMQATQNQQVGHQLQGIREFLRARSAAMQRTFAGGATFSTPQPAQQPARNFVLPAELLAGPSISKDPSRSSLGPTPTLRTPQDDELRCDVTVSSAPHSPPPGATQQHDASLSQEESSSVGSPFLGGLIAEDRARRLTQAPPDDQIQLPRRSRRVSVMQPNESRPVLPGHEIAAPVLSIFAPGRNTPPADPGSESPRPYSESGAGSIRLVASVHESMVFESDRAHLITARTAALEAAVAALEASRNIPLTATETRMMRLIRQAGFDNAAKGDSSPAGANSSLTSVPFSMHSFRHFQSNVLRRKSVLEIGSMRAASPAVSTEAETQWLEAVLRFTTSCAEAPLADRATVARLIQTEIQKALTSASLSARIWLLDPGVGLLTQADSRAILSPLATESPIARAFTTAQTVREPKQRLVATPMVTLGAVVAVLETASTNETISVPFEEDSEEATMVDAMAAIGSLFLNNARLFEDVTLQKRQTESTLAMARLLATDALEEHTLVNTIITTASELIEADRCSVFVVGEQRQTLRAFFDGSSKFIEIPIDSGFAGHVARTGAVVNIEDAYTDDRFNPSVDRATGYRTKSLLCMPVRFEGKIVAVAQLVNKKPFSLLGRSIERTFTAADEALFAQLAVYIGVCLRNCRANADLIREKRRNDTTLKVASILSRADIRQLQTVMQQILHGAKHLLNADRATLFLVDKEKNDLVSSTEHNTDKVAIRVPKGVGIVGRVAQSGQSVNVPDAYSDPRFNPDVDKQFGYRTVSIIAEPIFGPSGEVIAVAQLINRKADKPIVALPPDTSMTDSIMDASARSTDEGATFVPFTDDDHGAFRQFALFAGMALSNARLLDFAIKAAEDAFRLSAKGMSGNTSTLSRKQSFIHDVQTAKITEEMHTLIATEVPRDLLESSKTIDFNLFRFRRDAGENALDMSTRMVVDLIWSTSLPVQFGCELDTLMRFVIACRSRYRNVPYHNFYHAVDVLQTVHHMLYVGGIADLLEPLDAFVLMVVALVHDLDHMGLNNSYHFKTDSPLGILSSASGNTSVLEVHHCNLAVDILQLPETDVFSGLKGPARSQAIRSMIDCVLATDMSKHGDLVKEAEDTLRGGTYDNTNPSHRRLAMLHTTKAADISNVTKPFDVSRLWAASVTEEFYRQGDAEKAAGVAVLPMNDRSLRTELARGQLGFINFMARPYFSKLVALLFPSMRYMLDGLEANAKRWKDDLELGDIATA